MLMKCVGLHVIGCQVSRWPLAFCGCNRRVAELEHILRLTLDPTRKHFHEAMVHASSDVIVS